MPLYTRWGGFYIGGNASVAPPAPQLLGLHHAGLRLHRDRGLPRARPAPGRRRPDRLSSGRLRTSSSVLKARVTGPISAAQCRGARSQHLSATNVSRIDAIGLFTGQVGWAWNSFCSTPGAAPPSWLTSCPSRPALGAAPAATSGDSTRWGAVDSAASSSASRRTGRWASSKFSSPVHAGSPRDLHRRSRRRVFQHRTGPAAGDDRYEAGRPRMNYRSAARSSPSIDQRCRTGAPDRSPASLARAFL